MRNILLALILIGTTPAPASELATRVKAVLNRIEDPSSPAAGVTRGQLAVGALAILADAAIASGESFVIDAHDARAWTFVMENLGDAMIGGAAARLRGTELAEYARTLDQLHAATWATADARSRTARTGGARSPVPPSTRFGFRRWNGRSA